MISLFAKIFIKDHNNLADPRVRANWGMLCSILAIILNVILFAAKQVAGTISGSVAIQADAVNNLTDAGSAVLILLSFKFAGLKPTPERPFGHGRIEYIAGFLVSGLIIVLGVNLLRDSIAKIITPQAMEWSLAVVFILAISIAVKFYMAFFQLSVGKKVNSSALKAVGKENMSDTVSTFLALTSLLLFHFFGWLWVDGVAGTIVSGLIIWAGISSAWETIQQLLGQKADPEIVRQVEQIAMSYEEIIGVHDLIVHDYGPGRLHISLHAEVPGNGDIYVLHDAMDRCMMQLDAELGCESVIHMDPVCIDDEKVVAMRQAVAEAVRELDEHITIHDFRMVTGPTHDNVIFDAVVPWKYHLSDQEAAEAIRKTIGEKFTNTFAVVTIDKPFV